MDDFARWEIWEVGASKLDTMLVRKLPGKGFQALTEQNAKWLVGPNYSCPSNHHAYIVKAVYRKGGAGQFRAERNGNKLVVVWADPIAILGDSASRPYQESAVVVNLDFIPEEVFTETSFAL